MVKIVPLGLGQGGSEGRGLPGAQQGTGGAGGLRLETGVTVKGRG